MEARGWGERMLVGLVGRRIGQIPVLAAIALASLPTAAPAAPAAASTPVNITVRFSGTLTLNTGVSVVIPDIAGIAIGTLDAGIVTLPQSDVRFSSFPVVVGGGINTTVTIEPLADWTGSLDAAAGAFTLNAPLNAVIDLSMVGLGAACPLGPIPLALTTGTSGTATGTPYDATTGNARLVEGLFGIDEVPTDPAPAGCPGAATLNTLGGLPLAGGSSVADLWTTIATRDIAVGNGAILEGDSGTRTLFIPVTLSAPSTRTTTVRYAVTGLTAKGGTASGGGIDFKKVSGTLTFTAPPGGLTPVQKSISITVYADKTKELGETLRVTLSSPTGGYTLRRAQGTGSIFNDDVSTALQVGVGDPAVTVGKMGTPTLAFPVTLSRPSTKTVKTKYIITGVTAQVGVDFGGALSGTLSIPAGARQGAIKVDVYENPGASATTTLKVKLSNLIGPTGSKLTRTAGTGTLIRP